MKLLESLLDAIVRLEGDALVMHVGEKPYVVTTSAAMSAYRGPLAWGQVELSSRVLTPDAVQSMLTQVLSAEQYRALDELGAIEHEIPSPAGIADRFTVVAARGGDDIWLELRRQPPMTVQEPAAAEQPAMVAGGESADAAVVGGVHEPPVAGGDVAVAPEHVPAREPEAAAVHDRAPAHEEIQERVPVLDEVGQQQPEHVEHVVISVGGRDGHEEVPLDSVPNDAFEVVDEVAQEAPSDSEVDAMLAATAAALLTSGLGADMETIEDDVAIDHGVLEIEDDTSAAVPDEDRSEAWTELGIDEVRPGVPPVAAVDEPAEQAEPPSTAAATPFDEPDALVAIAAAILAEELAPVEEAPPADETAMTTVPVGESPAVGLEQVDVESPPAPEAAIAAAEAGPSIAAAAPAPEIVPGQPAEPDAPADERAITPHEPPIAAQEPPPEPEPPVEGRVEAPVVAAGFAAPPSEPVVPETAAAASAEPPATTVEPRTPVSDTLTELQGHGAQTPRTYQDSHAAADSRHGVVVPLGRGAAGVTATLQSALRTAGARGAGTVYLVAQSKPVIRVNGEIVVLENEPVLSANDVQGLVAELAPPQRQAQGEEIEWMSDVPGVGRVRCLTFRDHRGPGVIFRMDHAGLSPEVRALCTQPDGLVLIAGPHASGKSTLLNAFIDQINVSRGDHVIMLESHIGFVHESRKSFISQREQAEDSAGAAASARAALREDPDVLVIEDLRSADLTAVALEAAESGRLVFATVSAPSAVAAVEQLLESFPADRRGRAARSLASALRGVVSQVLVRRTQGGRVPAREVLLNTATVASMIRDGRTGDLPAALESGRGQGLVSMTDALVALVREGAVPAQEAYRKASDRTTLLGRLKQEGVDTAFADRLV